MIKEISSSEAYGILQESVDAVLIDVRTKMEYEYVGHPKDSIHIALKEPPEWKEQGANRYTPVPYLRFPTYMYCTFNRGNKQCGKMIKKKPIIPI